jgi:hypothetical protein
LQIVICVCFEERKRTKIVHGALAVCSVEFIQLISYTTGSWNWTTNWEKIKAVSSNAGKQNTGQNKSFLLCEYFTAECEIFYSWPGTIHSLLKISIP